MNNSRHNQLVRGLNRDADKKRAAYDTQVEEWVGLHYRLHWESLSAARKNEFRERYNEALTLS